jgi:NAD+ kinase
VISVRIDRPQTSAILSMDGQVNHPLAPGDRVEIRQATERAPFLVDPERNFYQVLQTKLKWGGS